MKKRKGSVYIQDWMKFHPLTKQSKCDNYYLGISKEVYEILNKDDYLDLLYGLEEENYKDFACFLTCYFEDIISKIGIWKTFISAHSELYNRFLPFYRLDEYFEEEINPQDIYFLIWYFLTEYFLDEFLIPEDKLVIELGNEIYEIFDRDYESAPENLLLKNFLTIPHEETDFFKIREIMDWYFINSYLFHFKEYEFESEIEELINSEDEIILKNVEALATDYRDQLTLNSTSSLLAFRAKDWLARFLGSDHPLYQSILELNKRITGIFLYKGEDDESLILQHLATDNIIHVTKKSMEAGQDFEVDKTFIFINLIKWQKEWWFTGIYSVYDYDEKVLEEEKHSAESLSLFQEEGKEDKLLNSLFKSFLEFNDNKPIAFFENGVKVREFVSSFIHYHNNKTKAKELKAQGLHNLLKEFPEDKENLDVILFFSLEKGLELLLGLAHNIPDKLNSTYQPNPKESILDYFHTPHCSPYLLNYLLLNYPEMIKELEKEMGGNFVGENADFLIRYMKHNLF
ncbi:MAG: DUF3843 family protein [Bacteroidales bacterium]